MKFICFTCGCVFDKSPSAVSNKDRPFCSKSCAAVTNNMLSPKRMLEKHCIDCNCLITRDRTRCRSCYANSQETVKDMTLGEVIYHNQQASNRYAKIRDHARRLYAHIKVCERCGYDKHVEICHIKAVSSFSLDTKLSVINGKENILFLCPNCHWEFDHQ